MAIALATVGVGYGSREASRSDTRASTTTTRVEAAIETCHQRIEASVISKALKDELKKSCAQDPGGDGMTAQAQMARREVCRKVVLKQTRAGPARRRGLAACAVNTRYP